MKEEDSQPPRLNCRLGNQYPLLHGEAPSDTITHIGKDPETGEVGILKVEPINQVPGIQGVIDRFRARGLISLLVAMTAVKCLSGCTDVKEAQYEEDPNFVGYLENDMVNEEFDLDFVNSERIDDISYEVVRIAMPGISDARFEQFTQLQWIPATIDEELTGRTYNWLEDVQEIECSVGFYCDTLIPRVNEYTQIAGGPYIFDYTWCDPPEDPFESEGEGQDEE